MSALARSARLPPAVCSTQPPPRRPARRFSARPGAVTSPRPKGVWKPVSDRKIRVGIVGYGACQFGAAVRLSRSSQRHRDGGERPLSRPLPGLAQACRCQKTYPSLEEMVKDDAIEAIFLATDAPSHARHAIDVLQHGKHVATAVPAVFGSLEDADKLWETVKTSGRKYMMFETSAFHDDCHAMRQIYQAGGFGKLVYSEGEYFHYMSSLIPSYLNWRVGTAAAMVSHALQRLLRLRDRRQLHGSDVPGDAQHHQGAAAAEQPLQEPLRHRDRAVADQRRRDVADGRLLGQRAARKPRSAASMGSSGAWWQGRTPGRRGFPTSSVRPCRPGSIPAGTVARTALS